MAKAHDVVEIRSEEVQTGYALVIPGVDGSPPTQFNVEAVRMEHMAGCPAMMKFTSEVVPPAARPLVIEYPVGAKVLRLLRTYDDGS
jgi:hypothetical protein